MNLVLSAPSWLVGILFLTLAAAALEDAWRLRINNLTCLAVFLLALLAAALHGYSPGVWQNLLIFGTLLLLGTVAFSTGLLGGGDVKLLSSLGLWLDVRGVIWLLAAVFIAGGVLALLLIAGRRLSNGIGGGRGSGGRNVPYAIAIAAGGIISFTAARVEQSRQAQPMLPVNMLPSR